MSAYRKEQEAQRREAARRVAEERRLRETQIQARQAAKAREEQRQREQEAEMLRRANAEQRVSTSGCTSYGAYTVDHLMMYAAWAPMCVMCGGRRSKNVSDVVVRRRQRRHSVLLRPTRPTSP